MLSLSFFKADEWILFQETFFFAPVEECTEFLDDARYRITAAFLYGPGFWLCFKNPGVILDDLMFVDDVIIDGVQILCGDSLDIKYIL